jgi:hypothetical protein
MLEDAYSRGLKKLLESCECDLAVPSEWLDRLTRRGVIQPIADDRRRYVRHHFCGQSVLEYDQTLTSIPREHTIAQVVTRDLSRSGIAFLHSDQLFPGEQVSLWLPGGKRSYIVERCVELNDHCFEIGASVADNVPEASTADQRDAGDCR